MIPTTSLKLSMDDGKGLDMTASDLNYSVSIIILSFEPQEWNLTLRLPDFPNVPPASSPAQLRFVERLPRSLSRAHGRLADGR